MSLASNLSPIVSRWYAVRHTNPLTYTIRLLIMLMLMSLTACERDSNTVYTDFIDIPSEGWARDEFCEFNTADRDSALFVNKAALYDVILTVRHTDEYPYTALAMSAVQSADDCPALPDTLRVSLMNRDGNWLGRRSKGIYTRTDTILRNVSLPLLYSLRLFHKMPGNPLPGLLSIGVTVKLSKLQ